MKKFELKQIIREEIQRILEGKQLDYVHLLDDLHTIIKKYYHLLPLEKIVGAFDEQMGLLETNPTLFEMDNSTFSIKDPNFTIEDPTFSGNKVGTAASAE